MLKLKDNPPLTLPDGPALADPGREWTAVYTKPRQEKALAWDLCRKGVPYFLPLIPRVTSSGGRRRHNLYPLFTSYVFCVAGDEERLIVQKTERALHFVEIQPVQQAQFRQEIAALEFGLRNAPTELTFYAKLVPGQRVRVTGGPLKNCEGVIVNADRKTKLLLAVTVLGCGAAVEIHADMVEPLSGDAQGALHGRIEYQVGEGAFIAAGRVSSSQESPQDHPRPRRDDRR